MFPNPKSDHCQQPDNGRSLSKRRVARGSSSGGFDNYTNQTWLQASAPGVSGIGVYLAGGAAWGSPATGSQKWRLWSSHGSRQAPRGLSPATRGAWHRPREEVTAPRSGDSQRLPQLSPRLRGWGWGHDCRSPPHIGLQDPTRTQTVLFIGCFLHLSVRWHTQRGRKGSDFL